MFLLLSIYSALQRLKSIHSFATAFSEQLCGLKTALPEGASRISPKDLETLRYAVRTDGHSGFVFINNFQDHESMPTKAGESIEIKLPEETILFEGISIAGDENCILPFHLNMQGIDLVYATAQPLTWIETEKTAAYVFLIPEGMKAGFVFEEGVLINGSMGSTYRIDQDDPTLFTVEKNGTAVNVLCISRRLADRMYLLDKKGLLFTEGAVLERNGAVYAEANTHKLKIAAYPAGLLEGSRFVKKAEGKKPAFLGIYEVESKEIALQPEVGKTAQNRYTITLPRGFMQGAKDVLLRIDYCGDIGHAFIDGHMISDNFCNGDTWEIGLRTFADRLEENPITVYITPLKEGASVNVDSPMAARSEKVKSSAGKICNVRAAAVYEMRVL